MGGPDVDLQKEPDPDLFSPKLFCAFTNRCRDPCQFDSQLKQIWGVTFQEPLHKLFRTTLASHVVPLHSITHGQNNRTLQSSLTASPSVCKVRVNICFLSADPLNNFCQALSCDDHGE